MKKYCIILVILCVASQLSAQKTRKQWYVTPQIAGLMGEEKISYQFGVTGGWQHRNLRLGMGVASDYYKLRSIPVFADIRLTHPRKQELFAYLNLGYNLPQPTEDQKINISGWGWGWQMNQNQFKGGAYVDVGVGADLAVSNKHKMQISLGYSIKEFTIIYPNGTIWPSASSFFDPSATDVSRTYSFRRLALRVGFTF